MATSSNRDVRLGVGIETTGEDGIRRLAADVLALAKSGGDAAPEYAALAAELDKLARSASGLSSLKALATDVDRLTGEQAQAAKVAADLAVQFDEQATAVDRLKQAQAAAQQAVRENRDGLASARQVLRDLVVEYQGADKSVADFTSRQRDARAQIDDYRKALVASKDALRDVTTEVAAAQRAERAIGTEYAAAARSALESTTALKQRNAALSESRTALEALGVDVTDLAAAEDRLLAAQREAVGGVAAARANQARAQAEADALAATEARGLADALDRGRAAAQSELAAIRDSEQFMRQYAATMAANAEAAKRQAEADAAAAVAAEALAAKRREQAEADRLAIIESVGLKEAQQAGAAAAQTELTAIRESEQFLRQYTQAKQEAVRAEASAAALAAKRAEQAEADRLAALEARSLAEAMERARVAAQSELAAIRDSEQFMARYAVAAREAAVATGKAAASGQELATAFGVTGLRSMQAIQAEIARVNSALATLQAQARNGTISAEDLARATSAAGAKLQQLRVEIESVPAARGAFEQFGGQVSGLINQFAGLGAAVATAAIAFKPFVDNTIKLEQMNRALTTITGSTTEAAKQIEFLRSVSQKAGQSFSEVGDAYTKFVASAASSGIPMQTVQKTFAAVALAAGNLGLSSEQTKRALEALSQMASKGTVSMEELRQQLGDALPGALSLMAQGLGITQADLIKLVESGNLAAHDALPALAEALAKLGPAGGEVKGIVAEFNRLKNVVLEAGAIFTDGPFGFAIGAALKAIGQTLGFIAIGVSTISEAFRVAGVVIYEIIRLIVDRDLKAFAKGVSDAASQSADRLTVLVNRFNGVGTAATDAAAAAGKAADGLKVASAGAASAATDVGKATVVLNDHSTALGTVAVSAGSAAQASTQAGAAIASAGNSAQQASGGFVAANVALLKQIEASKAAADAAKKHAEAVKQTGEATAKAAEIAGDDVAAKRASAEAAANNARALGQLATAERSVADLLAAQLQNEVKHQQALGRTEEQIQSNTRALHEKAQVAQAEAEKAEASALSAKAEAAARQTLTQTLNDNSASYQTLTANVDAARNEFLRLQTLYAAGLATFAQMTDAALKLSNALALQRDALADAARFQATYVRAVQATNAGISAGISVREASAAADLKAAQAAGNAQQVLEAEIRVKEVAIERTKAQARATVDLANVEIKHLETERAKITGMEQAAVEARREIDISIELQRNKLKEAAASKEVVRGLEAETEAIRNRNRAVLSGISNSSAGANSSKAVPGDPYGRTQEQIDALKGQGGPVDASYQFQLREKLQAGTLSKDDLPGALNALRVAKENAYNAANSSVPSLTGIRDANDWVNTLQQVVDKLQGQGFGSGGAGQVGGFGSGGAGQAGGLGTGAKASTSTAASDPYATLGLTSPTSAAAGATAARQAFQQIYSSSADIAVKQDAFVAYAKAAMAANGGKPTDDLLQYAASLGLDLNTATGEIKFRTTGGDKVFISDTASDTGTATASPSAAGPTATAKSAASTSHTVNINLGGKSTTINTASADDASSLVSVLRGLEDAAGRTL